MFNGKYSLNNTSPNLKAAFGISDERYKEIMHKLNAVANIYPKYIAVLEVWMNCINFTDMEKAFGLFVIGRVFGMGNVMRSAKIRVIFPQSDLLGKLFKKLYTGTKEIDSLTEKLLSRGVN